MAMLDLDTLKGKSFLDIGSGSGLFSLAAMRSGAKRVLSFDFDPKSVACTNELKHRFYPGDERWHVERGDVLDTDYLAPLGKWDIVYSWGVLHHTGDMWQAFENVSRMVARGGYLWIAIYNDQGFGSKLWLGIKKLYNYLPNALKFLVLWPSFLRLWIPTFLRDLFRRGNPFDSWRLYYLNRGMSPWRDVIDWVGGYPFEVAKPDEIFNFFQTRGFTLARLKTVGGELGNNELVFRRDISENPGD